MIRSLLFVIGIALFGCASAETINAAQAKNDVCGRYEIFHINGVLTLITGATDNLNQLRVAYGNAHEGHLIAYGLAYNQTRNMQDLLDSYDQVVLDFPGATFVAFLRAIVLGVIDDPLTAEIVATIAARLALAFDPERPAPYMDSDLLAIETAIRRGHAWNGRALLVPHSQGNLYANLVYDRLIAAGPTQVQADSLGIMAIATPASTIRGATSTHVTSENDRVINGVRFVFSNTLRHTTTIPVMDTLGHNLIGVYLTNPFSKATIVEEMSRVLSQLKARAVGDPPVDLYPHAQVMWDNCGPGSGNPYNCYHPLIPGQLLLEPYYVYAAPGTGQSMVVTGDWDAALAAVATNARVCQFLGEADLARLRASDPYQNSWQDVRVAGCFGYGAAFGMTYNAMSGDTTRLETRVQDPTGLRRWASGHVGAACRRST